METPYHLPILFELHLRPLRLHMLTQIAHCRFHHRLHRMNHLLIRLHRCFRLRHFRHQSRHRRLRHFQMMPLAIRRYHFLLGLVFPLLPLRLLIDKTVHRHRHRHHRLSPQLRHMGYLSRFHPTRRHRRIRPLPHLHHNNCRLFHLFHRCRLHYLHIRLRWLLTPLRKIHLRRHSLPQNHYL